MSFSDLLILMVPEAVVLVTALVVLTVDLVELRHKSLRQRSLVAAVIATAGCLVAMFWLGQAYPHRLTSTGGWLVLDPLVVFVKQAILLLTIATAFLTRESGFTNHVGEYFLLLLLATLGMMFLVSSENLLMIFVALELLSLSLYIMTAFNKRQIQSAEAGLKYFLFGGMSAGFLLFGFSWLYGCTGELALKELAPKLAGASADPLLLMALAMVAVGLGFKVAAVPFHLWAPDTYQGAPLPSAAFIASGSKVASFFILAKLMVYGLPGAAGSGAWHEWAPGWVPMIAVMASLSMVLGNLAAIVQSSVKRLLAYSAVAHAGYMLLGLLANDHAGISALMYYVITYALTTVGAFAVVTLVQERWGGESVASFAGLSRRAPVLAFCMLIFLLSLAGIPPLAGFVGKFYLFIAAAGGAKPLGLLWLVILAIAMSAVALYYYLVVLKQIYVEKPPAEAPPITAHWATWLVIVSLAAGVFLLGCFPHVLIGKLSILARYVSP